MSASSPSSSFITSLFHSLSAIPPPHSPDREAPSIPTTYLTTAPLSNPLLSTCPNLKPLLLTLHALFPNELLPALDLLDRHLVTRLRISPKKSISQPSDPAQAPSRQQAPSLPTSCQASNERERGWGLYIVSSASQPHNHGGSNYRSHYSHHRRPSESGGGDYETNHTGRDMGRGSGGKAYEVRLNAWNCSCPAFAFAAFTAAGGGGWWEDDGSTDEGGGEKGTDADEGGQESEGNDGGWSWSYGGLRRRFEGEEVPVCKHLLAALLAEVAPVFGGCKEEKVVDVEEGAGWAAGWGD